MITFSSFLAEARKPKLDYEEKHVKNALTKVIVTLGGSDSAPVTKLTKRYDRLDRSAKLLKEKRDELNASLKTLGDNFFDAEDALATRIIETVSYTVMLTAAEKAEHKKPKKAIDFEAAFAELALLVPELTEQSEAILKKYTQLIPAKDTPVSLRVSSKVNEGVTDTVKIIWAKFTSGIMRWARHYDRRLAMLKRKYPV